MVGLALSLKSAVMVFVALLLMYLFILSFRDEAYANSTDGRPAPTASLPVVVIGDKVLDLHNRGNYLKSKVLRIDAPGDMAAHKHKHNGNNKRQFQSPGTPEFEKDLQLPIEQQQQQQQQQQQEDDEDNDVQDQGEENLVSIIEHTPLASVVVRAAAEAEQPTLIASSTQHEIKVNRVDPQEIELENAARELVKHGRFLNEGPTYDSKVAVSGAPVIDWSSTYFPLHETLSAEQVLERQQYFLDSRWSYVDYGGGYQSPNDLRYASRTTIAIFYTQPHVVELRRIVGDLHFFAFGRRIVIYTTHLSDDQLWEVGRFMHAAVFKLSEPLVDADAQSIELARTDAYRHARYFFGPSRCRLFDGAISHCTAGGSIGVAFLPPSTSANKYLCRLDQLVQEQAKHAYSASAEQAPDAVQIGFQQHAPFCGTTPEPYAVCLNPHEFLTYNPHAGGDRTLGREVHTLSCYDDGEPFTDDSCWYQRVPSVSVCVCQCSLHLRLDMPKPARPALPNTGKDKFCFCVAAFSSPNAGIQDQTIVADFAETLPTVLPSIKDFDFYIYAGTQVRVSVVAATVGEYLTLLQQQLRQIDPIWDSPERREQILKAMRQKFGPELDIPIRLFRYPLNPSLYDITFKFNSILLQVCQSDASLSLSLSLSR